FGIRFPVWLFNSNPIQSQSILGHGIYDRANGTFNEPSIAGVLLTGLTLSALADFFDKGSLWRLLVFSAATMMVRSSASLLALTFGSIALCISRVPLRDWGWTINLSRVRRWALLISLLLGSALFVVTNESVRESLVSLTLQKSDTVSFVIRISGDLYALHLFGETYGLGIGLGGVRSSSLLATMLASVGVVGTGAFLWFIVTLLHAASTGFRWYLAGVLFAMCTGEPDMNL